MIFKVDTTTHCIDNRFRLLENFFLHEVAIISLHDLLEFHLYCGDLTGMRIIHGPAETMDTQGTVLNSGNIIILSKEMNQN